MILHLYLDDIYQDKDFDTSILGENWYSDILNSVPVQNIIQANLAKGNTTGVLVSGDKFNLYTNIGSI